MPPDSSSSDSSLISLAPPAQSSGSALGAAVSAAAATIPHAVGLGLLAFAPLAGDYPLAALALWSAALPGALQTLLAPRRGVVYAPTTVVALLYTAILATLAGAAGRLGMGPAQLMAACGATVALAFGFQWVLGMLRLAAVTRFLPVSVTQGFAAGVGLTMVVAQVRNGFGSGGWAWDSRLALHASVAMAVVVLAVVVQRRFQRLPGLLPAVLLVSAAVALSGWSGQMVASISLSVFSWPPLPSWSGIPWLQLWREQGVTLVSLAMLMALVNSLDILVFNQELELEYGLRGDANRALRRESLVSMLCALIGMIPASASASRSRLVLSQVGTDSLAPQWHAVIMLVVAATGTLWLHHVPMACLAGALLLSGIRQVPGALWSAGYARTTLAVWLQSWLVALVFAGFGGVGALMAGLVVATFVLLRASADTAVRRAHLDGQLRSRRLRRTASEAWLAPRMNRIAVFELQGVMSFGVAAHVSEQVRLQVKARHDRIILDASRVPVWDITALTQLRALARDLGKSGTAMAICAVSGRADRHLTDYMRVFADLDRALEWAEESLLDERSPADHAVQSGHDVLGEVGEGLQDAGRIELERLLRVQDVAVHEMVFRAGDTDKDLVIVESGRISVVTSWPPETGLRLTSVGQGMAFGEMAFLSGMTRSACAGTEDGPARLLRLSRENFNAWAKDHPQDALILMGNLAIMGTRRLGTTTRQLRAVLE